MKCHVLCYEALIGHIFIKWMVYICGLFYFPSFSLTQFSGLNLLPENKLIRIYFELFLFLIPPYLCKICLKVLSSMLKPNPYLSKPQRIFLEHCTFDFNQTLWLVSTFSRFDDLLSIFSALGCRVALSQLYLHFHKS